jgi:hypothetical protein
MAGRPDNESEILGPAPIDRLCVRCKSMFSSLQSLRKLLSPAGYEHYSRNEVRQHAVAGCPFCREISAGNWTERYGNDDVSIHLKAAYNGSPIHANPLKDWKMSSYPTSILKMNTVISAEPRVYHTRFHVHTPSGKHPNVALLSCCHSVSDR